MVERVYRGGIVNMMIVYRMENKGKELIEEEMKKNENKIEMYLKKFIFEF